MTGIAEVTVLVYADRDGNVRARVTETDGHTVHLPLVDSLPQALGYVQDAFWLVSKSVEPR